MGVQANRNGIMQQTTSQTCRTTTQGPKPQRRDPPISHLKANRNNNKKWVEQIILHDIIHFGKIFNTPYLETYQACFSYNTSHITNNASCDSFYLIICGSMCVTNALNLILPIANSLACIHLKFMTVALTTVFSRA